MRFVPVQTPLQERAHHLYCSNDDCATRKEDTPINKEINKIKEKQHKAALAKLEAARAKEAEKAEQEENETTDKTEAGN